MKRSSRQRVKKMVYGKCFFCGEADYALLDVHRIVPGTSGGTYASSNTLVTCALCHRKIHSGQITVLGKYNTTRAIPIVRFLREGTEYWVYEERD